MPRPRTARWGAATAAIALVGVLVVVAASAGEPGASRSRPRTQPWPIERRALLGELAVLRRPQRKSDLDPRFLTGPLRTFGTTNKFARTLIRRATTASGQHVFLIPVEHSHVAGPGSPGLLIIGGGGGGCCSSAATVRDGQAWLTSGPPDQVLFIVPDGVARLSLTLRTGPDRSHPPSVSGRARDNAIVLRVPFAAETLSGDPVTWYGTNGRVISHFVES
jgi:hypothetical protein